MTKHVFPNSMVAHVWAQQSQDNGRSANGHLYFNGRTIYSYGSHFPIASFTDVRNGEGQRIILVTNRSYSNSTSKHKHEVWHALRGLPDTEVIHVYDPQADRSYSGHERNQLHMLAAFNNTAAEYAKPRKRFYFGGLTDSADVRCATLQSAFGDIVRYSVLFDITPPDECRLREKQQTIRDAFARYYDPAAMAKRQRAQGKRALSWLPIMQRLLAHIEGAHPPIHMSQLRQIPLWALRQYTNLSRYDRRRFATADYDAFRVRRDYRERTACAVTPEQWLEGCGNASALQYSHWNASTLVRRVGDRLETSRGAIVPFQHALVAFLKAQKCRTSGETWRRNGDALPVGHFQVDAIASDGTLHAGCHKIEFEEMRRLAVREVPQLVKATYPLPVPVVVS